jgi:hypothetical protein
VRLESVAGHAGPRPIRARPFHPPSNPLPRRSGTLSQRPVSLGTLSALDMNVWFASFEKAGDDYVIKSGMAMQWMTWTQ